MKRLNGILAGCLIMASSVVFAEPSAADQKWLETVQKMVEKGENKISTPSPERVKLLQDWATKQAISIQVTKTDAGYTLQITKDPAKNIAKN